MDQQSQQQPTTEHYQRVINRLSQQIGAMTVEKTSMAELMLEKEREIMTLKAEIEDLKGHQAETSGEPQPVA